jgi:hypothetical protein
VKTQFLFLFLFCFFSISISGAAIRDRCDLALGYILSESAMNSVQKQGKIFQTQRLKNSLQKPNAEHFVRAQKGQAVHYGVLDNGVFVFIDPADWPKLSQLNPRSIVMSPKGNHFFIEAGELVFAAKEKKFHFKKVTELFPTTREEQEIQIQQLKSDLRESFNESPQLNAGLKPKENPFEWIQMSERAHKGQVVSCGDIYSAQTRGDNFLLTRLLVDNAVLGGIIFLRDPSRLEDSSNYDLLGYQFAATNLSSTWNSLVTKYLFREQWSYKSRLAARLISGLASNRVQMILGSYMLGSHEENGSPNDRSEQIELANSIWTLPALIKGDLMDKVTLKYAPNWAHNLCLKNSRLSFFVGPGFLRIADRISTQFLYLAWISHYTTEPL